MEELTLKKSIVFGSVLILLVLSFIVLRPIFLSVIAGLLLAYMASPVYKKVFSLVREKNIAALIIVLLLLFIIFLPIWFLFPVAVRQAIDTYAYSQKVDLVGFIRTIIPADISVDVLALMNSFISHSINSVFSYASNMLLEIPVIMLQAVVVLFVFFFGMRDADRLKEYAKGVSPFSQAVEKNLLKQFKGITNSVVYGHIIVGIIQGLLTGVGLFIFGVPKALLLTVFAVFASVIPILGAWLVWIPVSFYLFSSGHIGAAVGLVLYGAIFISWIDNFIRPYIVSRRTNLSSGVVLVGMIGGLIVFGILGLVLGPLILSYLLLVLDAYRENKLSEIFAK